MADLKHLQINYFKIEGVCGINNNLVYGIPDTTCMACIDKFYEDLPHLNEHYQEQVKRIKSLEFNKDMEKLLG